MNTGMFPGDLLLTMMNTGVIPGDLLLITLGILVLDLISALESIITEHNEIEEAEKILVKY